MRIARHVLLVIVSLLAAGGPAAGQELIDRRQRGEYRIEPNGRISLDQAADMAQRRYRAKVVRAETVRSGDRYVHQIRLLNAEGKVWTVRVDADSGAMH